MFAILENQHIVDKNADYQHFYYRTKQTMALVEIGNYIFDTDRLLIFRNNIKKEEIEYIQPSISASYSYKNKCENLKNLLKNNHKYNLINTEEIGICISNNCNLRCNYCIDSAKDSSNEYLDPKCLKIFLEEIIPYIKLKNLYDGKNRKLLISITGSGEQTFNWYA